MPLRIRIIVLAAILCASPLVVPLIQAGHRGDRLVWRFDQAAAQTEGEVTEKEAFEGAKELGTIEAWEAFLNRFSTGFRADLARAYVKRLGTEGGGEAQQPAAATKTTPAATLQTVDLGPGEEPWETGLRVVAAAGNQKVYTASVQGNGLELVTFCVGLELHAVLRESPRGVYPEFEARLGQGMAAAPELDGGKTLRMSFSNGATFDDITIGAPNSAGEVAIGDANQAISQGPAFNEMLAGETMTIAAPPLSATFQLTGSRAAICDVFRRCGATKRPECGGSQTETRKSVPKKQQPTVSREASCRSQGLDYRNGKCVAKQKPQTKTAKSKAKIEANAAANCRELGLAYRNGQCVAKLKKDIQRLKKQKKIGCPEGTYLNPLGVCQPNETGG